LAKNHPRQKRQRVPIIEFFESIKEALILCVHKKAFETAIGTLKANSSFKDILTETQERIEIM